MDVNQYKHIKKTKIFLVFFCILLLVNCNKPNEIINISVNYKNNKGESISFISDKNINDFSVNLKNMETAILGNFYSNKNAHTFNPVIFFSTNQEYQLKYLGESVGSFTIENKIANISPELLTIYPTTNVLPENLLKMYFVFSKPMQEVGNSLDFITVFNETINKEVKIFLDLETELWNKEHTVLTLWLDPGRIKTDLIPNIEKGLPILNNNQYSLTIDRNWKDAYGINLAKTYEKEFKVVNRDNSKPLVNKWELLANPDLLIINFNEPLDGILANEVFIIVNSKENIISGEFKLTNDEQTLEFTPNKTMIKGDYSIIIESRLEDLAGNNLNHLFDVDLIKNENHEDSETKTLRFTIN